MQGNDDTNLRPEAGRDEENAFGPPLPPSLAMKVDDLFLTVRAKNVLAVAGIQYVGDLVQLNEGWLASIQNCGQKTIDELKEKLAELGLAFGMKLTNWGPPAATSSQAAETIEPPRLADLSEESRTKLLLRVTELDLSVRAQNVLHGADIEFVGDLVGQTPGSLRKLYSCGATTVEEIEATLKELDLGLGMQLADWSSQEATAARKSQDRKEDSPIAFLRRKLAPLPSANCLEDELKNILDAVATERDTEICQKQLGWTGFGQRTLESVGGEYGVTRERIRQIVARACDKIRPRGYSTPWLTKSLALMRSRSPATATEIAKALHSAGLVRTEFDPTGLESACEVLGRDFDFCRVLLGHAQVYVQTRREKAIVEFFRLARKLTSGQGCANFDAMCDELRIPDGERDNFRLVANVEGLCEWLDDEHRWLIANDVPRNRLANLAAKVLSVAPKVNLQEMRRAVARSRRLAVVPPTEVLARFLERQGMAAVSGNLLIAVPETQNSIEPDSTDHTLVSVLRSHGPILAWDRFQELCMKAGMNPTTFGIYLSGSPLIARVARGIYSLVGADVPPGAVEDIEKELAASRKPAEWGWSPRGTLWYALRVTGTVLGPGAVSVPSFVSEIADGEWRPHIAGSELDGTLKCNGRFLWGLRRPLANAGAELGDICILEFDIAKRTVAFTLGGEELVDMWENGDIDIPPLDLPEDLESSTDTSTTE